MVGVGVGGCVGIGEGVGVSVGVAWMEVLPVVGVGVGVVATVAAPYADTAQIHSSSAAISVPHPRPILALRERVRNHCRMPGLVGGEVKYQKLICTRKK
jgi:hypothetical protein